MRLTTEPPSLDITQHPNSNSSGLAGPNASSSFPSHHSFSTSGESQTHSMPIEPRMAGPVAPRGAAPAQRDERRPELVAAQRERGVARAHPEVRDVVGVCRPRPAEGAQVPSSSLLLLTSDDS